VIRRNAILLPAYSLMLGVIALLGFMGLAAGLHPKNPQFVVPDLMLKMFPPWFAGFAFAAIAIGALVPAAVMSIAAANLFTRNIYREYFDRDCPPKRESDVAKMVSLVVKLGALLFALLVRPEYAINLQLLGGSWILQTFPTVVIGLYTRWFHRRALLAGWLVGMIAATWMAAASGFKSPLFPLPVAAQTGYIALWALAINLSVATVLTWIFDAVKIARGEDKTLAPVSF
jgi:SSS family solute:Na+ symporter